MERNYHVANLCARCFFLSFSDDEPNVIGVILGRGVMVVAGVEEEDDVVLFDPPNLSALLFLVSVSPSELLLRLLFDDGVTTPNLSCLLFKTSD